MKIAEEMTQCYLTIIEFVYLQTYLHYLPL